MPKSFEKNRFWYSVYGKTKNIGNKGGGTMTMFFGLFLGQ
jgi:hypothetical protein